MNHRERFGQMPPLANDWKNPGQSEVLLHICRTLSCDLEHAQGVFAHLRKTGIIVFRKPPYRWQGCAYLHAITQDDINADLTAKIRNLEGQLAGLRNAFTTLKNKYLAHLDQLHPGA
ncbi:MAG: hypothetical protein FJ382_15240 [Verrucomicrobia bacterium]|nr:hypothetical protein [Verrucomicrobiota bacterium]